MRPVRRAPLESATVSFGQILPQDVLSDAINLCKGTNLVLAIGSSLVVSRPPRCPYKAKRDGARLVILNGTETPLDPMPMSCSGNP